MSRKRCHRLSLLLALLLFLCAISFPASAEGLLENYASFASPENGSTWPAGRIPVSWSYSSDGVTGLASSTAENYVTYFTIIHNGQVYKESTHEPRNIDFTTPYAYDQIMLKEPGEYRFIVATAKGTDAPDSVVITVTDPLREGTCGNGLTWRFNDTGTLFISGYGRMTDWDMFGPTYIPWGVFDEDVRAVVVDDGVSSIGSYSFDSFPNLTSVTLGKDVREIGEGAFLWCTSLASIRLPEGVKTIPANTFDRCMALVDIYIPASVTEIEGYAFHHCDSLKHVYYQGTQAQWEAIAVDEGNRPLLNAELHCDSAPATEERPLRLPDDLVEIQDSAFAGGTFTHVYLDGSVRTIGARAFANCAKLAYISIPASTTSIAADAFEGCPWVVIGCKSGSAAYRYAVAHGLAYQLEN